MKSVVKSNIPMEYRTFPIEMERRNTLLAELDEILNTAKTEKRTLTQSEQSKFERIKNQIKQLDKELMKDEVDATITSSGASAQETEEIRSFVQYVKTGEARDLAGANNGSIIPTTIANMIVDKVHEISPIVREATKYYIGEDLNLPVYNYENHVTSFLTEFTDIVESGGTFASVALKSKIIGTMAKLGKSLVNRSELEVLPFIINACAKSVARFLETEIILNVNARFASTLATGVTQTMTTATTLVIAPEEIVKLKNSIPSIMLPNAKFLMHKDTLSYLQSLKDTQGRFIFGNSLAENNGNVLLGHEVMLSDSMPKIGVGARQIYFGDFTEGLAIKIGAQSAEVYKELYAKQYAIGIGHFMEVDCSASHSAQSISVMVGK